jgi:putative FmdB family regulatory protein
MPFYEYTCNRCATRFELIRRLAERDEPTVCPSCGAKNARRELPRVSATVRDAAPPCGANSCGSGSFG